MYLVIAEKPSVSRSIANVIGATRKENGYFQGNGAIVSWCLGHLAEYEPPDSYDERFKRWNFEDLPIIPENWKLAVSQDKKEQFSVLKKLLNSPDVEYVVNACDAGREGELIFKRVFDLSKCQKPVKRLWISSMEDHAIKEGFQNMKDGSEYDHLADAAVCRAQADWLVGMNATRAYTTKYYKKLTVGRVQTPTLTMLVERGNAISDFKKEKYFNVSVDCNGFQVEKQKIFDPEEAKQLMDACQGSTAVVEEVVVTDKKVKPPKLYDLTTLQREANRQYGLTAQQTLNAAQSLYEDKLITYPRTDSQYLTEDMEETAGNVIRLIHEKYHLLGPFAEPQEPNVKQVMNNKKVTDHHAIIPTAEIGEYDISSLSDHEQKILFLIAVHMIAAVDQDHVYSETKLTVRCANEVFTTKGKTIRNAGWKIYDECFKNKSGVAMEDLSQVKGKHLPVVEQGQTFEQVTADMSEHFTSPPKPYSEDTLLAAMESAGNKEFDENTEKKGLGTPATRAGIIEKLVHSQYAERKGKQILPTEDGNDLILVLPDFLKSASMTAEWENQLNEMEKGNISSSQFMDDINQMVDQIIESCKSISYEDIRRFQKKESIGICPLCGSPVYENNHTYNCSSSECRFVIWKEPRYLKNMRKKIDVAMAKELLAHGRVRVQNLYSQRKKTYFQADLLLNITDNNIGFSMEFPNNSKNKERK